jgi:hypothetical protein
MWRDAEAAKPDIYISMADEVFCRICIWTRLTEASGHLVRMNAETCAETMLMEWKWGQAGDAGRKVDGKESERPKGEGFGLF